MATYGQLTNMYQDARQNAYDTEVATIKAYQAAAQQRMIQNYGSFENQISQVPAPTGPDKRLLLLEDTP